ncbi:similar to Kazachstania africana KAFR_0H02170 hypothetical protein [Maudiozyma saulgeensis]|uniref:Myb-like domain-containing protein n=1 Tax=Maudiozyma saulgeensis TaxID=1789683 RepID=A0A1X7R5C5_9SACH|nr:similar to Kazachstania africana KAFR_0H02170 hypothetical protein [Kazachstania saulgeensis]
MSSMKFLQKEAIKRYYDMYNKEVTEFFQIGQSWDYSVRSSRVHSSSQVSYVERTHDEPQGGEEEELESDDDDDDTVGSYWTGVEKRIFFKLLSRYSIHRITEWSHILHDKSIFEIMEYYKILQKNLKQLRRQKFKGLVKIADMDIAYEMDEQFIDMEEYMSTKPIIETKEPGDIVEQNVNSELIDINNWKKRWDLIYSKSHLEEIQTIRRQNISIDKQSIQYMELLIKQQLRRLLWYTILPEIQNKKISKRSLREFLIKEDESNKNKRHKPQKDDDEIIEIYHSHKKKKNKKNDQLTIYPTVITSTEVDKAITIMKNERNTKHTQTLGESVMDTINKYEIHYRPLDGNIFRKRSVRESIIPEMVHQTTSLMTNNNNDIDHDLLEPFAPTQTTLDHLEYDKLYAIPSENREARDDELDAATDARDTELSSQICQTIYSFILKR